MKFFPHFVAAAILLLTACHQRPAHEVEMPDNPYIASIFLTFSEGHFRGHMMGSSLEEVKIAESARLKLVEEQSNHLFYEYVFPRDSAVKGSLEYAEIRYFFKDDQLDIITVGYFLNSENGLDSIEASLSTLFNTIYGLAYRDPGGYSVWDITYEPGKGPPLRYDIGIKKVKAPYSDTYLAIEYMRL